MSMVDKSIVVTRDVNQAKPFVKQLKNLGANVFQFPTLHITDVDDREKVKDAVSEIGEFDWIIFTSVNAIKYFSHYVDFKQKSFLKLKLACVGNKTAELLTVYGHKSLIVPEKYTTKDLLLALQKYDLRHNRILLPVSNIARLDLEQGLQKLGAQVRRLEVYQNIPYDNPAKNDLNKKIYADLIDCITFFSPSALHSFVDIMGDDIVKSINARRIAIAVIGPTTAQAVLERGLNPVIQPEKSESNSLIRALEQYFANNKSPLC